MNTNVALVFIWMLLGTWTVYSNGIVMNYPSARWVKRDSYLPVGSQNLKATTKVYPNIIMRIMFTSFIYRPSYVMILLNWILRTCVEWLVSNHRYTTEYE